MQMFRIIGAVVGGALVVSVMSIVWPRFSADPRPEVLTNVHNTVIETPLGQNLENILGVGDDAPGEPQSISAVVATGANAVVDAVAKSAQHAVTSKILESLAAQFQRLTEEEKAEFRAEICEPVTATP